MISCAQYGTNPKTYEGSAAPYGDGAFPSEQGMQAVLSHRPRQAPLSLGFCRQNAAVGCHALLQGISPTRGSNLCLSCLLHWHVGASPPAPAGSLAPPGACGPFCFGEAGLLGDRPSPFPDTRIWVRIPEPRLEAETMQGSETLDKCTRQAGGRVPFSCPRLPVSDSRADVFIHDWMDS